MIWWLNIYDTFTERWLGRIRLSAQPAFVTGDELGEFPVEGDAYAELGLVRDDEGSLSFTVEQYPLERAVSA